MLENKVNKIEKKRNKDKLILWNSLSLPGGSTHNTYRERQNETTKKSDFSLQIATHLCKYFIILLFVTGLKWK